MDDLINGVESLAERLRALAIGDIFKDYCKSPCSLAPGVHFVILTKFCYMVIDPLAATALHHLGIGLNPERLNAWDYFSNRSAHDQLLRKASQLYERRVYLQIAEIDCPASFIVDHLA